MPYNPLVSIIVPVYNVVNYLEECIGSLIHQEYKNIEIIIVDDGSLDGSGKLADDIARTDERIRVIHNVNSGVSHTRNIGIDDANGEYVCFVDADDYVTKDYVSYMLSIAQENDAEIVATTKMFGNYDNQESKNIVCREHTPEEATKLMMPYRFPIGCYCKLFKKTLLDKTGIRFNEDLFIGEGFNFNVDAFQRTNKVISSNKKIYYYRRDNPTSAMTVFSEEKCTNGLKALEIMRENLILNNEKIIDSWKYANWRTHSDFYDMIVLSGSKKKNIDLYVKCKKVIRKEGRVAFKVPISKKDLLRAIVMMCIPSLIPIMLNLRRIKYHLGTASH